MDHAGESASGLTGYRAIAAFLADGRDPPARRASDPRASRRAPPLYTSSLLLSWKSCIDAQTPQDWGQFGSIKSFFASHALVGSCAQLGQSEYLSSQASVHTPHISGHSFITDDGFVPHSCSPQMWHCLLRAAGKGSVRRRGQARRCAASAARRGELRWRAGEAGRTARAGPNLRRRPVAP